MIKYLRCANPLVDSKGGYPVPCHEPATQYFEGLDGRVHYLCAACATTRAYRFLKIKPMYSRGQADE